MLKLEGIRINNYKTLHSVALGSLQNGKNIDPLTPVSAIVGKHGAGKSTLFDAMGFLCDMIKFGVPEACIKHRAFASSSSEVSFELSMIDSESGSRLIYKLSINGSLCESESLSQKKLGSRDIGMLLSLAKGQGYALKDNGERDSGKSYYKNIWLNEQNKLGIANLGFTKDYYWASLVKNFILGWRFCNPLVDLEKMARFVERLERTNPATLKRITQNLGNKIPGIESVTAERIKTGKPVMKFKEYGSQTLLNADEVSRGVLKVLALEFIIYDKKSTVLLIEDLEANMRPKVILELLKDLSDHARKETNAQVLLIAYQPYIINSLRPEEVWGFERGRDGYTEVTRASDSLDDFYDEEYSSWSFK